MMILPTVEASHDTSGLLLLTDGDIMQTFRIGTACCCQHLVECTKEGRSAQSSCTEPTCDTAESMCTKVSHWPCHHNVQMGALHCTPAEVESGANPA
jgi:hypothetical protein